MMVARVDAGIPAWADQPRHPRYADPDTTHGVPCPHCAGDSRVVDSRPRYRAIKRRRVCFDCKRRFTTYEIATDTDPADAAKMLTKQASELRTLAATLEKMAAGQEPVE